MRTVTFAVLIVLSAAAGCRSTNPIGHWRDEPAAAASVDGDGPSSARPRRAASQGRPLIREGTLEELEQLALSNNPTLAEAQAAVQAARGRWVQAGLWPNPRIAYVGEEIGDEGTAGQQGGLVGQQLVTGRKLRFSREAAAWEIQRAEQELAAQRLRVLTDTRIGYYDVLIEQRRRGLAADLVRISDQGVEAAEALFRGGEVSEADPLRARVEAAQARILLDAARNRHLEAWRRLAAVLGIPQLEITPLRGRLTPAELRVAWQESLQQILTHSPEMAAALAEVEAARWTIQRARAEVVPNIDVQTAVQRSNASDDTIAGVQVELPVPLWNRNQGAIRQAQAELVAAQRAVDRLTLDLQTRLAAAFQRYQTAHQQVERYSGKGGIIDNARRTLDLIRAGYQAEEFGVLDLLTAQRTYFETELTYLDALRQLWAAVVQIRGLLLRDSLRR